MRDFNKKYGKYDPYKPLIYDDKFTAGGFNNIVKTEMEAIITRAGLTIGAKLSITGITRSGSTATATTAANHNLFAGLWVDILGADQGEYNGSFEITGTPNPDEFTYEVEGTPTTPATGTIQYYVNQIPRALADSILNNNFFKEASGSAANAYILERVGITTLDRFTAYTDGLISFKVVNTNTGASTINIFGLGVKAIVKAGGVALSGGEIVAGAIVSLSYDSALDNFRIANGGGANVQEVITAPLTILTVTGTTDWVQMSGVSVTISTTGKPIFLLLSVGRCIVETVQTAPYMQISIALSTALQVPLTNLGYCPSSAPTGLSSTGLSVHRTYLASAGTYTFSGIFRVTNVAVDGDVENVALTAMELV